MCTFLPSTDADSFVGPPLTGSPSQPLPVQMQRKFWLDFTRRGTYVWDSQSASYSATNSLESMG